MAIDANTKKMQGERYIEKMQDKFKNNSPHTRARIWGIQIQMYTSIYIQIQSQFQVVQLGCYIPMHGDRYTENSYFCHQASREAEDCRTETGAERSMHLVNAAHASLFCTALCPNTSLCVCVSVCLHWSWVNCCSLASSPHTETLRRY